MQAIEEPLCSLACYKERLNIALRAAEVCVFEVGAPDQRCTVFEHAESISIYQPVDDQLLLPALSGN